MGSSGGPIVASTHVRPFPVLGCGPLWCQGAGQALHCIYGLSARAAAMKLCFIGCVNATAQHYGLDSCFTLQAVGTHAHQPGHKVKPPGSSAYSVFFACSEAVASNARCSWPGESEAMRVYWPAATRTMWRIMHESFCVMPWRKGARIVGASLLALALAGCTVVRLAYNQAPNWASVWIDNYADLDDEQGPRTRDAIGAWFRWHRSTQLPEYAGMLARMQAQVMDNTTGAALCRWEPELLLRTEAALAQAVVPATELVVSLRPQQLRHIEKRYERSNQEFRDDYLQPDLDERREERHKRTVERLEKLYGRLDDAQRERLSKALAASPYDAEVWQQERLARQRDTLQTLRSLTGDGRAWAASVAQAEVKALMGNWLRSPRPAYAAYQRKVVENNCAWLAELHNSTTPEQRRHARAKLRGWEADARALGAATSVASAGPETSVSPFTGR